MFEQFRPQDIPALIVASGTCYTGLWPLWNARSSMLTFGFPTRIAEAPAAHPVMVTCQVRTTILGMIIFAFYSQSKRDEIDTVLAIMGTYAGLVDSYVFNREGNPSKAIFRLIVGLSIGAWGFAGMTGGH
ncbi:hypothetical protein DL769_010587 [Monosporascus sp. CRB-8-3]|nr:hypothetical protein DL769_010587 [Monosporascus sp. CRB-8-3]